MSSQDYSVLYSYKPSQALPIAFGAIITTLVLIHVYQAFFRYRWFHFGLMFLWASLVWIAGFVFRALAAYHVDNVDMFICQYVLILAGPVLYAASEYFILGRLLAYVPYHTPIQPGRVLSTFLFLSAAVEALTASGSATVAKSSQTSQRRDVGLNLVKAGLLLQSVVELCFFWLVVLVEYRCRKGGQWTSQARVTCYVLYTTSMMILVRCIFRTVQGFQQADCALSNPNCSVIDRHEWFLWVFEVANITVFIAAIAIFHPGRYFPRDSKIYQDFVDPNIERIGPGFANATNRSFLATLLDPFDLVGIFNGDAAARIDKFWERDNPIAHSSRGSGTRTKASPGNPWEVS